MDSTVLIFGLSLLLLVIVAVFALTGRGSGEDE